MVERFFRDLSVTRLGRGVFHSLPELIAALEKYLLQHNEEPQPYIWMPKPRTSWARSLAPAQSSKGANATLIEPH